MFLRIIKNKAFYLNQKLFYKSSLGDIYKSDEKMKMLMLWALKHGAIL